MRGDINRILGHTLIKIEECASTNTVMQDLVKEKKVMEGAVIMAKSQTNGRGQRGNSWESAPGKNLTMSVLLTPKFLAPIDQFLLSMVVSLGLRELCCTYADERRVKIKWPNDIYIDDKKVAGILIENSVAGKTISHAIAGIGLNVNQTTFSHAGAVSLGQLTGKSFDLDDVLDWLLKNIEKYYIRLRQHKTADIKEEYLSCLFQINEEKRYKIGSEEVLGRIVGVSSIGELMLESNREIRNYGMKEIVYLMDL